MNLFWKINHLYQVFSIPIAWKETQGIYYKDVCPPKWAKIISPWRNSKKLFLLKVEKTSGYKWISHWILFSDGRLYEYNVGVNMDCRSDADKMGMEIYTLHSEGYSSIPHGFHKI